MSIPVPPLPTKGMCPTCTGFGRTASSFVCHQCSGSGEIHAYWHSPNVVTLSLNAYQLANLRWMFRQVYRLGCAHAHAAISMENRETLANLGLPPALFYMNTGDWAGELPYMLIDAARRGGETFLRHPPNVTQGDGPSHYDTELP